MPDSNLTPLKFHFFDLKFTPRNGVTFDSKGILKKVIDYLMTQKAAGNGHLVNRYFDRTNEESREMFMSTQLYMHQVHRIRCSLALLRKGKTPMLKPADKFEVIPFTSIGTMVEVSHFFIDHSGGYPVICAEFNHHGPRIPDLEYYFRTIAHDELKLARATEISIHMDSSIDDTLANLKNVLNLEIKMRPKNVSHIDKVLAGKYFSGISSFDTVLKPKFIKLEALYQSPGNKVASVEINKEANGFVKDFLTAFKQRPFNIDAFDNFVIKYQDTEGAEQVFNLLKGKKEIIKEVDLKSITKNRQFYELIEQDFNDFMEDLKK